MTTKETAAKAAKSVVKNAEEPSVLAAIGKGTAQTIAINLLASAGVWGITAGLTKLNDVRLRKAAAKAELQDVVVEDQPTKKSKN